MSQHEGLPVSGYRPQSDIAVSTVNGSKMLEERVLRFLDELKADPAIDQRWLSIGRTAIEQGFMAVNRAVFQPKRIDLPPDPDPRQIFEAGYSKGVFHDDAFEYGPQVEAAFRDSQRGDGQ
ncbi:Acb2/Tad1 domain-containing protein [Paenirhodobacter populi]|uniref:Acb2/Tad1 domain-containing protein n=1 Tax=Paenirhodobacter populi TaxID=2306993 RepID=UPI0019D47E5C|nr:hypothetical protein [Sinirhodobacter populi]